MLPFNVKATISMAASAALAAAVPVYAGTIDAIPAAAGNAFTPVSVNSAGTVIGNSYVPRVGNQIAIYSAGTTTPLGPLSTNPTASYYISYAGSVTDSGTVYGTYYDGSATTGYNPHAFSYTNGSSTVYVSPNLSATVGANNSGTIVGGLATTYAPPTYTPVPGQAFIKTAVSPTVTSVIVPTGTYTSSLGTVSSAGIAAGVMTTSSTGLTDQYDANHLITVDTTSATPTAVDQGTFSGYHISATTPMSINSAGTVVGTANDLNFTSQTTGFKFTVAGGFTALTSAGRDVSTANGINDSGTIIGSAEDSDTGTQTAVVWLNGSTISVDLSTFLPANSGWSSLTDALAISSNGIVTGFGTYNGTAGTPFVLTGVPEPASLSMLAVSGLAMLRRRKR